MEYVELIKNIGLSEKAAKVYLANLEIGEATVNDLSSQSRLKRTTIYYVLNELRDFGAITETKRLRKRYFIATEPKIMLKLARERLGQFEEKLDEIELKKHNIYHKPRVSFLYGIPGFKKVWQMILSSKEKNYRILTSGDSFRDFVTEKYILEDIIKVKKRLGFFSKQIITDSSYGKKIIADDTKENRQSKTISLKYNLPFTEVICEEFVVFISPRSDNMIMIIESDPFVKTRKNAFDVLWDHLEDVTYNKNREVS